MIKKNHDYFVKHGRAVFYACLLDDLMTAAAGCGWQLGLYGDFSASLYMMAMPLKADATPSDELVQRICDCFDDNRVLRNHIEKRVHDCGRIDYLFPLWGTAGVCISTMDGRRNK